MSEPAESLPELPRWQEFFGFALPPDDRIPCEFLPGWRYFKRLLLRKLRTETTEFQFDSANVLLYCQVTAGNRKFASEFMTGFMYPADHYYQCIREHLESFGLRGVPAFSDVPSSRLCFRRVGCARGQNIVQSSKSHLRQSQIMA